MCNTQLNSCKQAQIHTDGKKHEKRLAYLKFSLDTGNKMVTSDYNFVLVTDSKYEGHYKYFLYITKQGLRMNREIMSPLKLHFSTETTIQK